MRRLMLAPTLVLGAFLATACDGTVTSGAAPTAPSVQTASLSVVPSTLSARLAPAPFCGIGSAFDVPFTLGVQAGAVSFSINEISMRFVNSFGVQMPQVTLPAPVLTTQFGSALVQARSGRSFPLRLSLGCGSSRTGTLIVIVQTRDAQGRTASTQVIATVL